MSLNVRKTEILWHLGKMLQDIMTIAIYDGHVFLIEDIKKLALFMC